MSTYRDIYVSRKAEQGFRRRAIARLPSEYLESIWGKIKDNDIYIYAFMPFEHTADKDSIYYEDEEHEDQLEDAKQEGYDALGSIHSHPECLDCRFSETDLMESQTTPEIIMGICAINEYELNGKKRHKTQIAYWRTPRPMKVHYL